MPEPQIAPSLVVVVDDDAIQRLLAVDLLQDAGYRTLEADSADAAFEIMKSRWQDVRLLFTDVRTPGKLNGLELAREVHRHWPDVLLMVTSGDDLLSDADLPAGGRFMLKPYRASTLVSQIRLLIEGGHRK